MRFYGVLILFVTLSAACALRCYSCEDTNCTDPFTCPDGPGVTFDRCFTVEFDGVIAKGCIKSFACIDPYECCSTDLCNGAVPTGSSVLLLLVSSAIITLFL